MAYDLSVQWSTRLTLLDLRPIPTGVTSGGVMAGEAGLALILSV
jgi:hypothetical protein